MLQAAIQALGGQAYLNVRDAIAVGRASQFTHSGDLSGYELFYDYVKYPDKDRTEFTKKRNLIEVFNGDEGWTLDRGGVSEQPADALAQRRSDLKKDIDSVLRYRLSEPGMNFRYAGPDVVDLKEADWVELVDRDNLTIRIALDRASHLPVREVIVTRDPMTRERTEELYYFSNYQPVQGVQTPFQVTGERNGQKISQIFLDDVKYNNNLSDQLFTKQGLEQRFAELDKKNKHKKR
jgi:hypothetical protein